MNNRTFSKLIVFLLGFVLFTTSYGQGFQRLYVDADRDLVNSSNCPLESTGFYTAGTYKGRPGTPREDSTGIQITRHNPKGNPSGDNEWSNDYLITDAAYSISSKRVECAVADEDTLIVVAVDEATRTNEGRKFLMKVAPSGEVAWSRTIQDLQSSDNTIDYISNAKVTAGNYFDFNYFGTHDLNDTVGVHFEKFDTFNLSRISRTYSGFSLDPMNSGFINLSLVDAKNVTLDSSFVLTTAVPGDPTRAGVLTIDSLGNAMQSYTYEIDDPTDFSIEFSAITATPDTGYVAVGICQHDFLSNGIVVKFDELMNVTWAKQIDLEAGMDNNQALDVSISDLNQIVVAGKYLTSTLVPGNYAVFMELDGAYASGSRFESDYSMSVEFTSGLNTSIDLSKVEGDMTFLFSTTGADNRPENLSPLVIKMDQVGGAICEDSLFINAISDVSFVRTEIGIRELALAQKDELEVRTVRQTYDIPTVTLGQQAYCPRDTDIHIFDASANINLAATPSSATYLWSTGETTPTLAVDMSMVEPGETEEYAVTITIEDRLCYVLCDTGQVSKTDFPTAAIGIDTDRYCDFNDLAFEVTATNPITSVVWEPNGETTNRITVPYEEGAMYSVTITDNCDDTAVATVTVPDLTPDPNIEFQIDNSALCDNGVLFLSADWPSNPYGGLMYNWAPGGATTSEFSITEGGTYYVTITDQCTPGHVAMDSIMVSNDLFVIPDPTIVIEQSGLQSFGNGTCGIRLTAVSMLGDGASSIPNLTLVHGGDVNLVLDVTEAGTYNAFVTQCGVQFDAVPITISEADLIPPPLEVSIEAGDLNPNSCDILLVATGTGGIAPIEYQWSNNVLGTESTVSTAGTYMVTATDACGQEAVAEVTLTEDQFVSEPFEVIIEPMTNEILEGCQVLLQAGPADGETIPAGATYLWSTGETTPSIIVDNDGTFSVTVTGCDVTATAEYTRTFDDTFAWPNIFFPQRQIHEINNSFGPQLDCPEAITGTYSLEIFNRWGKRVFETNSPADRWRGTLNNAGQFLEEDVYMYQWSYDGGEVISGHVTLVRS